MPDPKTGALPLGYAPMRILETNRKQPYTRSASRYDAREIVATANFRQVDS